jgi:Pyruvate/2-oxoacid:ferredoxin oxidoreductase delta subunit
MRWLSTVAHADDSKLVIEKMRLDETGFPQPTGEFEELAADCLVLALGQDADLAVLDGVPGVTFSGGTVDVGADLMTGHQGIFAGGDMVPAERTVTVAIGHGKKAARNIDAWLRGASREPAPRPALAGYGELNTWYYADAPATVRPRLAAARRTGTFDEVTGGLDESTALFEARRCMSCGNCFGCDNCYGACPDNAVIKIGPGGPGDYEIDYDYCKGCGICAAECPCGAIAMIPEEPGPCRGTTGPLRKTDATAGDPGRNDPHEQFPDAGRPGFHAGPEGVLALGPGDVVGRSLDEHAPAHLARHVDVVDLERHLVVGALDPGSQVLVQRAVFRGAEQDRPLVEGVVHRQHGGAEPAGVGDAADPPL